MSRPLDPPSGATIRDLEHRVASRVVELARPLPSSTLHEAAGRTGALPSAVKPVAPGFRLCGPAVTVQSPGGDNLWLHRALYVARPGDVLVVHVSGMHEYGYWGEIMSTAARFSQLGGLVIDGCVRDGALLGDIGFPVFARGLCMRGTGKDYGAVGFINHPLLIGEITIHAGDLIVGDSDGVAAFARDRAEEIVNMAIAREAKEADILRRLETGERTLQVYNF